MRWVCIRTRHHDIEHALMATRFPDGFFPRPVRCAPCCRVARALASGACVLAGVRTLLMLYTKMMLSPEGVKIWRPRQIYVGPSERPYVPVEERRAVEGIGREPSVVVHSG